MIIKDKDQSDTSQAIIQLLILAYIFLKENRNHNKLLPIKTAAVKGYATSTLRLPGNSFNLII